MPHTHFRGQNQPSSRLESRIQQRPWSDPLSDQAGAEEIKVATADFSHVDLFSHAPVRGTVQAQFAPTIKTADSFLPGIQRAHYYYGNTKEFKEENKLIGGNTTRLTLGKLKQLLPKYKEGDVISIQNHGQYTKKGNSFEATNKVLWADEDDKLVGGAEVIDLLVANGLPEENGNAFTLDLITCFGAGTKEQWVDVKNTAFEIDETVGYLAAEALLNRDYAVGTVVKTYVGASKVVGGAPLEVAAGAAPNSQSKNDAKEGWDVSFRIGQNKIEIILGGAVAKTERAAQVPKSFDYESSEDEGGEAMEESGEVMEESGEGGNDDD